MSFMSDKELQDIGFRSIGKNVKISCKASIYGAGNISIGSNVRIDDFCVLSAGSGGIKIGSYIHIAVYSSLIGKEQIELMDFSNLSSRVSIYSSSDDYSGAFMTNPTVPEIYTGVEHNPVLVGRHVIVGAGSVVLPGVVLGDGVAIGALSLVTNSCQSFGVYAGIPAKKKSIRKKTLLDLEKEMTQVINH